MSPPSDRAQWRTAKEIVAEAQADPAKAAVAEAQRLGRELRARRFRADSAGLLADLRQIGIDVESVEDLAGLPGGYDQALPVLAAWLPRIHNHAVQRALVRLLSQPSSDHDVASVLLANFDGSDPSVQWVIADGLCSVAQEQHVGELLRLLGDSRFGGARQMLALAVARFPRWSARAVPVLRRLLGDREVNGHAIMALGRLQADVVDELRSFESDDRAWVRAEARKAIKRITRAKR